MFSSQFGVPLGFISRVVPFLWGHIPHANHCVMTMRPAELGWAIWHCHWAGCFIISVSWWGRHWSRIYWWALLLWFVPWWLQHVFCDVMMSLKYANSAVCTGIILWMRPFNERWRYVVTSYLIGWAHLQNDPCVCCDVWYMCGWCHRVRIRNTWTSFYICCFVVY